MTVLRPRLTALLALVLGLGALVLAAGPASAMPADPAKEIENIAHRGSSGAAPENTLAAVRLALDQGADVVENDIQRTSDGELVIMHDTTLTRTTDVEQVFPNRAPWAVADFSLGEIKQLDAGSWFSPKYAGAPVPTLQEWVEAVGQKAGMLMEPKSPALYPGIDADLDKELHSIPAFNRALAAGRATVQCFDHVWLRGYKDRAPDVPVGLLYGGRPTQADIDAAATWAEQVNPALGAVDAATISAIRDAGLEAHVWTVNDGAGMRRAIDWGVDGIITNYPQVLRDILRRG
ncbi:MAG: glycerophosphodiester phosphodiesterase [Nocardioides sp.]